MCDANLHRSPISARPIPAPFTSTSQKRQELRSYRYEMERAMPGPLDAPLQTFTLFLESETGVLETTMGAFEVDGRSFLRPISCKISSGQPQQFTRPQLKAALGMYHWALSYPQVLSEARVIREPTQPTELPDDAWIDDSDGENED